jgi:hypothetical protein
VLHCLGNRIPLSAAAALTASAVAFGPSLFADFHALAPFGVIYLVAVFAFHPSLVVSALSDGDDLS